MRLAVVTLSLILQCILSKQTLAADQGRVSQLIETTERLCLSGSDYRFSADVNGNFVLQKGDAAQNTKNINIRQTNGGVGYLNEQVRKDVDEATRKCMQPYLDQIIAVILEQPLPGSIQRLGWISGGQTIAQAQLALRDRQATWQSTGDGRQFVSYGSLLSNLNMVATVFFDYGGKAYAARSVASSKWTASSNYRGGGSPDTTGVDPATLCGNLGQAMLSSLQGILGPAKQPPNTASSHVEPAWNITYGGADYCRDPGANCRSFVDISTTTEVFQLENQRITATLTFTTGSSFNANYGGDRWYSNQIKACEVKVEGGL